MAAPHAAAAPLSAYLAPLCQATLGAAPDETARAVAADLSDGDGALRWFLAQRVAAPARRLRDVPARVERSGARRALERPRR